MRALRIGAEAARANDENGENGENGGNGENADGETVTAAMAAVIDAEPLADLDYVACVRADTLEPVVHIDRSVPLRLLVAAQVGPVRLIDNLDPRRTVPPSLAGHEPVR